MLCVSQINHAISDVT